MVSGNRGYGRRFRGWDGFVLDNWFSGNHEAGIGAYEENAACTITGNRIEWDGHGGIIFKGGNHYNITGNYFDRSGGPAISLLANGGSPCKIMTVTGNLLHRERCARLGDNHHSDPDSHVRFEGVRGVTFTGRHHECRPR